MNPIEDEPYCDTLPYRKIHCKKYLLCLNYASKKNWCNFNCRECSDFEPERITNEKHDLHVGAVLIFQNNRSVTQLE